MNGQKTVPIRILLNNNNNDNSDNTPGIPFPRLYYIVTVPSDPTEDQVLLSVAYFSAVYELTPIVKFMTRLK